MNIYDSVKIADYGTRGLYCVRLPFGYSYKGSVPEWLLTGATIYFDTLQLAIDYFTQKKLQYDPA
jgi:hypothetical protein